MIYSECVLCDEFLLCRDRRKEVVDGPIRDAVFDRCGAYHGILHFDIYEVYLKSILPFLEKS